VPFSISVSCSSFLGNAPSDPDGCGAGFSVDVKFSCSVSSSSCLGSTLTLAYGLTPSDPDHCEADIPLDVKFSCSFFCVGVAAPHADGAALTFLWTCRFRSLLFILPSHIIQLAPQKLSAEFKSACAWPADERLLRFVFSPFAGITPPHPDGRGSVSRLAFNLPLFCIISSS